MENLRSKLYWIGVLIAYLTAFLLFGVIIALSFGLPDTMVGGLLAYSFIICGLIFGSDDETLEIVKYVLTKGEKGSLPRT